MQKKLPAQLPRQRPRMSDCRSAKPRFSVGAPSAATAAYRVIPELLTEVHRLRTECTHLKRYILHPGERREAWYMKGPAMSKNAKKQPKDTLWPPLDVRDLPPEVPARRENVRINPVADKLARALATRKALP